MKDTKICQLIYGHRRLSRKCWILTVSILTWLILSVSSSCLHNALQSLMILLWIALYGLMIELVETILRQQ